MSLINLLPSVEQRSRKTDQLNYYTILGGLICVIGTIALAGFLLVFDQIYRVNLQQLTTQKTQVESQAALFLDTEKKAKTLSTQLESLKKAQGQTTHWSSVLTELQSVTPPGVAIQSISIKDPGSSSTKVSTDVTGSASSRRSLGEFQLALSTSKYFKSVEIQSSNLSGTGGVDYRLTLEVNYDKLNGPLT
jgi:Tfp pilus assembly protein PilN